jgi:hypothetical protein
MPLSIYMQPPNAPSFLITPLGNGPLLAKFFALEIEACSKASKHLMLSSSYCKIIKFAKFYNNILAQ